MLRPATATAVALGVLFAGGSATAAVDAASELTDLLRSRQGREVAALATMRFRSTADGWRATGLALAKGQGVTLFAFGDADEQPTSASRPSDLLWIRLGDSDVLNLGSDTFSFDAWESAELEVGVRSAGARWADCSGRLEQTEAPPDEVVDVSVVAVAWKEDVESGLSGLDDHEIVAAALADHRAEPELPAGFRPLCHLPYSRVFQAFDDGERRGIRGLAANSAGIVKKAVDLPLNDDSELRFEWRWDSIPALGPENDARYHDYSSIAIELDNGQDITWIWSDHLDAGTIFHCPLPWWDQRETHIVLQSGRAGLGEWFEHTLDIAAEYDRAVGGERPRRIVGVWFISVGVFGDTRPDTTYANVRLRSGRREIEVFD